MKQRYNNFWSERVYNNDNNFFMIPNLDKNSSSLYNYIDRFWNDVMIHLREDQIVSLLFRVRLEDGGFRTLAPSSKISNSIKDKDDFFTYLNDYISLRSSDYHGMEVDRIIFSYHVFESNTITDSDGSLIEVTPTDFQAEEANLEVNKPIKKFTFAGYTIHNTSDYTKWGRVLSSERLYEKGFVDRVIVQRESRGSDLVYAINARFNKNEVEIKSGGKVLVSFVDHLTYDEDSVVPSNFTRVINNQTYVVRDGEVLIKKIIRKANFIKRKKTQNKIDPKYLTIDFETRVIDGDFVPYCVSLFDGKVAKSFYLSDFSSPFEMIVTCLSSVLKRKYDQYVIFAHNLKFDGNLFGRFLTDIPNSKLYPTINDGNIIDLTLLLPIPEKEAHLLENKKKRNYTFHFRDSKLMLTRPLKELAEAFKVENKGIFPYEFVNNPNTPLDYVGPVPSFTFFSNISREQYNDYCKNYTLNNWNLREESIKYCELDSTILWEILFKFKEIIFE